MARSWYINGPVLVQVKGRADSGIGSLQQLGLSADPIQFTPVFKHLDIMVDAYGSINGVPAEVQFMLSEVRITMNLIHFDPTILNICLMESQGGAPSVGALAYAGATLGNNLPRFAAGGLNGNHYIGLNLSSPVASVPIRFLYTYLADQPVQIPLGAEKSVVQCNWRAIPYTQDPYGGSAAQPGTTFGTGAYGALIYDYTPDT